MGKIFNFFKDTRKNDGKILSLERHVRLQQEIDGLRLE